MRLKPHFPYLIRAIENLHHFGCTLKPESVDLYTDYVLDSWINSKGHNRNLLAKGEIATVGMFTLIDKVKKTQSTISVFQVLYRR